MNYLTHNESYTLWRRQHKSICLYSVIHPEILRNIKKAFGQYLSFQAVSDGPNGVGSIFLCLSPEARGGSSFCNSFWAWDNGHCPEIHYHLCCV